MKKLALLVFVLLFFVACTKYVWLYPVNDLASTTGVLKAKYIESGIGYGEIIIVMPDGETLSGEQTTGRNINLNFDNILSSVYGTEGGAFGIGTSTLQANGLEKVLALVKKMMVPFTAYSFNTLNRNLTKHLKQVYIAASIH